MPYPFANLSDEQRRMLLMFSGVDFPQAPQPPAPPANPLSVMNRVTNQFRIGPRPPDYVANPNPQEGQYAGQYAQMQQQPQAAVYPDEDTKLAQAAQQAMAMRQRRLGRLGGMKDIAEGLGKIQAITPGEIMYGRGKPEPIIAENTREEMARLEDEIPDYQLQAFNKGAFGGRNILQPGMTYSRLQGVLPSVAGVLKSQMDDSSIRDLTSLERARAASMNAETSRERLGFEKGEKFDYTKEARKTNILQRGSSEFQKIAQVRQNALAHARQAMAAIESGSQTGLLALNTLLQKAAGDVGNISQTEQQQYSSRVAILDRIGDYAQRLATGEITEGRKEDILKLLDSYEAQNEQFYNEMADVYAQRYSALTGEDAEFIKSKILMPTGVPGRQNEKSQTQESAQVPTSQGQQGALKALKKITANGIQLQRQPQTPEEAEELKALGWSE